MNKYIFRKPSDGKKKGSDGQIGTTFTHTKWGIVSGTVRMKNSSPHSVCSLSSLWLVKDHEEWWDGFFPVYQDLIGIWQLAVETELAPGITWQWTKYLSLLFLIEKNKSVISSSPSAPRATTSYSLSACCSPYCTGLVSPVGRAMTLQTGYWGCRFDVEIDVLAAWLEKKSLVQFRLAAFTFVKMLRMRWGRCL